MYNTYSIPRSFLCNGSGETPSQNRILPKRSLVPALAVSECFGYDHIFRHLRHVILYRVPLLLDKIIAEFCIEGEQLVVRVAFLLL